MITLDDQWNDFGGQVNADAQSFVLVAQSDVQLSGVDVDQLASEQKQITETCFLLTTH